MHLRDTPHARFHVNLVDYIIDASLQKILFSSSQGEI